MGGMSPGLKALHYRERIRKARVPKVGKKGKPHQLKGAVRKKDQL